MFISFSKFTKSLVEIVHGIPEAQARKERAEASMKEIEVYERYLELLKKAGFSEKELKEIILSNKRIIKELNNPYSFIDKGRIKSYLPPPILETSQKDEGEEAEEN